MIKNLDHLEKAPAKFELFRKNIDNEQLQAGAVQAFEFCYELTWKVLKRTLEERGLDAGSPKDTFRKSALEGIIHNPEIWFFFQTIRNLTAHIYEQTNLDTVIAAFDQFSHELNLVIQKLKTDFICIQKTDTYNVIQKI